MVPEGTEELRRLQRAPAARSSWMFTLFNVVASIITTIVDRVFGWDDWFAYAGPITTLYYLAVFLPSPRWQSVGCTTRTGPAGGSCSGSFRSLASSC